MHIYQSFIGVNSFSAPDFASDGLFNGDRLKMRTHYAPLAVYFNYYKNRYFSVCQAVNK